MIKKIVCPTDFSQAANNATEYAAKLAQAFGAELLFVNVQKVSTITAAVSLAEGPTSGVRENSRLAGQLLKDLSEEANKMFNISTDYEVDITTHSLETTLSTFENNVMIVMGTNGIDDNYQYFFGTNTYNVIKKAKCPVLIIPETKTYGDIRKIVFAWELSTSKFSFPVLFDFMDAYSPTFLFLHVNKNEDKSNQDVFKMLRDVSVLNEKTATDFKEIFSDDIPDSINTYMLQSQSDMLVLTHHNRGIGNVFRGSVTKDLSAIAAYPILVLHD